MKQTILLAHPPRSQRGESACLGTVALAWLCYGVAAAALWRFPHGAPQAQAVLWALALFVGLGLAIRLEGFGR